MGFIRLTKGEALVAELTGRQRLDARPARCMMNQGAARAWWPAGGAPVERPVRRHSAVQLLARDRQQCLGIGACNREKRSSSSAGLLAALFPAL